MKVIRSILNSLGILDAQQMKKLAAEVLSLRSENQLLRSQVKSLGDGHKSILSNSQQMHSNKNHAELMQWDSSYLIAYTALGLNQGRKEARAAASRSRGNDPKQVTGMKASRALVAIKGGKSPDHTHKQLKRNRKK